MDLGLEGKPAVAKRGSRGIGPGLARALVREGAMVLPADRKSCLRMEADNHALNGRFGTVEKFEDHRVVLCSDLASDAVGSAFHVVGGMLKTI